jgi:hypothetical protein
MSDLQVSKVTKEDTSKVERAIRLCREALGISEEDFWEDLLNPTSDSEKLYHK